MTLFNEICNRFYHKILQKSMNEETIMFQLENIKDILFIPKYHLSYFSMEMISHRNDLFEPLPR